VSEDLSFLPDAPPASSSASPPATKPAGRRASAGLTPAPKKAAAARRGSRGRTLGPADLAREADAVAGAVDDPRAAHTPDAREFGFLGDVASGVRSVVGSFARVLASPARFAGAAEKSGDAA